MASHVLTLPKELEEALHNIHTKYYPGKSTEDVIYLMLWRGLARTGALKEGHNELDSRE